MRSPPLVHRLFAEQAARTPHAEAVVGAGESISYAELDARSSEIGARLRGAGVGRDVVVGVCAERSIEMMAAFLGVLKAGGAYLYLDPGFPRERLWFICGDSGARVMSIPHVSSHLRPPLRDV